jgi:hypothetical protein
MPMPGGGGRRGDGERPEVVVGPAVGIGSKVMRGPVVGVDWGGERPGGAAGEGAEALDDYVLDP